MPLFIVRCYYGIFFLVCAVYFLDFSHLDMAVGFWFLFWSFPFCIISSTVSRLKSLHSLKDLIVSFVFIICLVNSVVHNFPSFSYQKVTGENLIFRNIFLADYFAICCFCGIRAPLYNWDVRASIFLFVSSSKSSVVNYSCELLWLSVGGMIKPWQIWKSNPFFQSLLLSQLRILHLLPYSDYLLCCHQ